MIDLSIYMMSQDKRIYSYRINVIIRDMFDPCEKLTETFILFDRRLTIMPEYNVQVANIIMIMMTIQTHNKSR